MKLDYRKLGLRCGMEIHQQLDTAKKLFCACPARFSASEHCCEMKRKMHAVTGEMGKIDEAAMHEFMRDREFLYRIYHSENCLVETDSEPPHSLNMEALITTLKAALMLNCEIPDEVHVMRKTVIDGSNTGGFQRTLIAGLNGRLKAGNCQVGITNVCLEEDSAQILEKGRDMTVYGLDRLGIPLIEIGTTPDIHTPDDAKYIAEKIGMLLRSTGKAKRGIGTIRQDINVSIAGGARIEIKGAQELRLIPKLVQNEVMRQLSILEIGRVLKKRGFRKVVSKIKNVATLFRKTENKIMKGKQVFAILVPGFEGMLARKITDTRTLGNEIANYVKVKAGIPGIIHSDENLQKYRLDNEFIEIGKKLGAKKGDTVIIMAAEKDLAKETAGAIEERINQFMEGVPREVRRALDNGDTEYMRPMPGAERMYPETDVTSIRISSGMLSEIREDLPEIWDNRIKRIAKSYSISHEMSRQLVQAGHDEVFERLSKKFDPKLVSNVLLSSFREMEKEGLDTRVITEKHLSDIFGLVVKKAIAKEALSAMLRKVVKSPAKSLQELAGTVKSLDVPDLEKLIVKVIESKKELLKNPRREKVYMGLVMKEVRGEVDGKTVMETLVRVLKKY
ncbi:MAG: Glu-tRNA(Gln) amidotransferase subunit GatE [Candidatus Aenigmatarchaeota archaeon]|nr:MAG: Glu-tRNA(Gln) amidotransferase subunit GatE [Candidatus Aenigmarchaeota archaeon]